LRPRLERDKKAKDLAYAALMANILHGTSKKEESENAIDLPKIERKKRSASLRNLLLLQLVQNNFPNEKYGQRYNQKDST